MSQFEGQHIAKTRIEGNAETLLIPIVVLHTLLCETCRYTLKTYKNSDRKTLKEKFTRHWTQTVLNCLMKQIIGVTV